MSSAQAEKHFSTTHLNKDLKSHAVSGGVISGLLQAALLILNFGAVAILARLLTPQDFGLVAMVLTVTGFFRVFADAGLSTATIQKEGVTHAQVSNLFWVNLLIGGVITILLAASAPVVSWFFQDSRLVVVMLVLSLTFVLASATVQHMALLRRQMRFKAMALVQLSSTGLGVCTGILMAWVGYGYWSLVGMQVMSPAVGLVVAWWVCGWRPQFPERNRGTRALLNFGANLTIGGLLWSLAKGMDNLLVGKWFGTEALGYYSRVGTVLNRTVEQVITPLEAIVLPAFSRLQTESDRYRRAVFQVYDVLALCSLPITGMLLALADPITLVILGPQWEAATSIFAAFTLYALYVPLTIVAGWVLTSQGRGREFVIMSCFTSSVSVLSYLVGIVFDPFGVALSFSLSCLFVQMPFIYWIVGRRGWVTTGDLWKLFFKHFPVWAIVCAATWVVRSAVEEASPLAQLLICIPVGLATSAGVVLLFPSLRLAAANLIGIARGWLRNSMASPTTV